VASLQHQLNIGLSLTLAALLLALWWFTAALIGMLAEELIAARLHHDAESLLQATRIGADGALEMDQRGIDAIYQRPLSGHYYMVQSAEHRLRSRSLWDHDLGRSSPLTAGQQRLARTEGPAQQPLLTLVAGFNKQGTDLTVTVAEDISSTNRQLRRFHWAFGLLTLLIILASLLLQRRVVRHSLQALDHLRQELRQLEQGRILTISQQVPNEVRPLVDEVNHLLLLLKQRLERSRNALGNLAHSLKRPINLIRQSLDDPASELDRQQIRRLSEEIRLLTERELKRARLAGNATPGKLFDAARELPQLLRVLERLHAPKRIRVELQLSGQEQLRADRDDMLELFGNLLDNAFKWATQQVRCCLSADRQDIRIVIEDDGPGCQPEMLRDITDRGARLDESREGHGLGLAMVRDLLELYGGAIEFANLTPFGFRVSVRLPRNPG
jgi:signal transduction histidine kinase